MKLDPETAEAFRSQCDEARSILMLAERRLNIYRAKKQRTKHVTAREGGTHDPSASIKPSELHTWLMDVQIAGKAIGKNAVFVMYARLCRARKSAGQSWSQIAHEIGLTTSDARMVFQIAVPLFLYELRRRGITSEYRTQIAA